MAMKVAKTGLTTFSTVLLTLFVCKTAEQDFQIPAIVSLNPRIPISRSSFFQSQQPDPQVQRQFHQIASLRQLKQKQSSPVNKKFRLNTAIFTGQEPQRNVKLTRLNGTARKKTSKRRNGQLILISDPFVISKKSQSNILRSKSQLPQFVRLRKLLGFTAAQKMRKNSNRKDGRFRPQNFRSGQSNFSNKLSLALKVAATSQLLLLTTAATPPSQDKSNFGLETNDLRSSSPDNFSTKFGPQKLITTNGISREKGSTFPGTLPHEQQRVTFQNVQQNSEVREKVSSPTIEKLEIQTSPTIVKPLPPPAKHTNSKQNSPSSVGPPGFSPPNDKIIEELNDAQNFLDLAESMHLKQMFKNNNTD